MHVCNLWSRIRLHWSRESPFSLSLQSFCCLFVPYSAASAAVATSPGFGCFDAEATLCVHRPSLLALVTWLTSIAAHLFCCRGRGCAQFQNPGISCRSFNLTSLALVTCFDHRFCVAFDAPAIPCCMLCPTTRRRQPQYGFDGLASVCRFHFWSLARTTESDSMSSGMASSPA